MKDTTSIFAVGILGLLGFVAFLVVMALLNGWAIATLWGWFVVPLGVKAIGYANAIGLSFLVSTLMSTRGLHKEASTAMVVQGILLPIISVFLGFITVQFM